MRRGNLIPCVYLRVALDLEEILSTAMSIGAVESAEKVLYKQFKYRAVNPLEHQLRCLDVIVKIEQSLLDKAKFKISSDRMRPLMRLGSMIEKDLMATESTWYSEGAELERMREGLEDLENVLMPRSFFSDFKKKKLISTFKMSFSSSKRVALWLSSVAGIDLGFGESLSCTMGGLTSTSVDYTKICTWIEEGSWKPKIPFMQKICSEWEKPDQRYMLSSLFIESLSSGDCLIPLWIPRGWLTVSTLLG